MSNPIYCLVYIPSYEPDNETYNLDRREWCEILSIRHSNAKYLLVDVQRPNGKISNGHFIDSVYFTEQKFMKSLTKEAAQLWAVKFGCGRCVSKDPARPLCGPCQIYLDKGTSA